MTGSALKRVGWPSELPCRMKNRAWRSRLCSIKELWIDYSNRRVSPVFGHFFDQSCVVFDGLGFVSCLCLVEILSMGKNLLRN